LLQSFFAQQFTVVVLPSIDLNDGIHFEIQDLVVTGGLDPVWIVVVFGFSLVKIDYFLFLNKIKGVKINL
jgi:hypothetical protein